MTVRQERIWKSFLLKGKRKTTAQSELPDSISAVTSVSLVVDSQWSFSKENMIKEEGDNRGQQERKPPRPGPGPGPGLASLHLQELIGPALISPLMFSTGVSALTSSRNSLQRTRRKSHFYFDYCDRSL